MLNDLATIVCKSYCIEGNESGAENVRFTDPLCTYVTTIAYSHYKYVDYTAAVNILFSRKKRGTAGNKNPLTIALFSLAKRILAFCSTQVSSNHRLIIVRVRIHENREEQSGEKVTEKIGEQFAVVQVRMISSNNLLAII